MVGYLCGPVRGKCYNGWESYGEICVGCKCCSDDKKTRWQARLELHQRLLEHDLHFENWVKGAIRLQKRNIKQNIKWNNRRIARYKYLLKSMELGR